MAGRGSPESQVALPGAGAEARQQQQQQQRQKRQQNGRLATAWKRASCRAIRRIGVMKFRNGAVKWKA